MVNPSLAQDFPTGAVALLLGRKAIQNVSPCFHDECKYISKGFLLIDSCNGSYFSSHKVVLEVT